MEHDEKILNYIAKDENISQRQLAKLTDLSLGHLNLILHQLVQKGLIKIEKLNARNLRYILTPQGIVRNTKRTCSYIKNAVKHVLMLKGELEQILDYYETKGYTVYIDGEKDEIYQIVKQVVSEKKLFCVNWITNTDESIFKSKKSLVILWDIDREEIYKTQHIEHINILNRIGGI